VFKLFVSGFDIWFVENLFYYTPTTKWVRGYNGFALSRRSVGPSVRQSVRLHYRVRLINPIPIEGFSLNLPEIFTLTRECAEPMLPMCQLKVKVTIEGQISNHQISDIMSCPLCKSYTD